MAVRATMNDLINLVRVMIADPAGTSQQFNDQQIQDRLDASRDDIRYESLQMAPSIVNTASTSNIASVIFSSYYSDYNWWEADGVLQGFLGGAYWKVLTPVASDYITGLWQFETNEFVSGTVPGQLPAVFATGKVYDPNSASADLLEFWAASYARRFDFSSDGQSFKVSQASAGLQKQAEYYRRQAKPKVAKMVRHDVALPVDGNRVKPLGDNIDLYKGR